MTGIEAIPASDRITRRRLLTIAAASAAGLLRPNCGQTEPHKSTAAATGESAKGLEPFDELMLSFVRENQVPGGALAVSRQGQLVYARGFGSADVETQEPVQPEALFRIASVSKPLTAVAVLQLVERGRLQLEDLVLDHLPLTPLDTARCQPDPRWSRITLRHCLQHTGGWDRDLSGDPIGKAWEIARAAEIEPPVSPEHIVRYMLGQPLDFDPGARYAYSNLGYLVLGRIIAAVTGQSYESYVQQEVLGPLGIHTMRLGRALAEHRAAGEVCYYDSRGRSGPALYPPRLGEAVPVHYGAANFEAYEAHGGWLASAGDLVKFASAFDHPDRCPVLAAAAIQRMWERPGGLAGNHPDGRPQDSFYACGWSVRPIGRTGRANTWHTGRITGSEALLVRRWDGLNWAVLFNTDSRNGTSLAGRIDGRLHDAADQVSSWPDPPR